MKKISRRSFLVAAGISAAMALTACSSSSSSTAASSTASSAASAADSAASSTQAIQTLDDLAGKVVGVQLGTTGDLLMSEEVGEGEDKLGIASVEQYNKGADAVQALLTNKIDAVCIDDQVAKNFVAAKIGRASCRERV